MKNNPPNEFRNWLHFFRYQEDNSTYKFRSSSKVGHEFGLKLTLFLDYAEYIGLFAPNSGARLLVHDPRVQPDIQTASFSVAAGETTFIAMKLEEVQRKGGKYNDCYEKWPKSLKLSEQAQKAWSTYTQESCQNLCLTNILASRCKCTDTYDVDFSVDETINMNSLYYCRATNLKQSECRNDVYAAFRNNSLACDCLPACHTNEYILTQSRSPWPSKTYSPYFASKMIKSDSSRIVSYMQDLLIRNVSENAMQQSFKENFVRLEIFYEALNFRKISESAAYDFSSLISDFGGNLGLCLGWSMLIFFELVEFFFHCVRAYMH